LSSFRFKRVYHPVDKWEELQTGMWDFCDDPATMLQAAIDFTSDWQTYGDYMDLVVQEWPVSCENALTDYSLNRKAWLGHAACAMAINCPENITRKAWGYLTDEQRKMANRRAAIAIGVWEENYAKSKGIRPNVERPMLFEWNP
jgi:hypothetical protein